MANYPVIFFWTLIGLFILAVIVSVITLTNLQNIKKAHAETLTELQQLQQKQQPQQTKKNANLQQQKKVEKLTKLHHRGSIQLKSALSGIAHQKNKMFGLTEELDKAKRIIDYYQQIMDELNNKLDKMTEDNKKADAIIKNLELEKKKLIKSNHELHKSIQETLDAASKANYEYLKLENEKLDVKMENDKLKDDIKELHHDIALLQKKNLIDIPEVGEYQHHDFDFLEDENLQDLTQKKESFE